MKNALTLLASLFDNKKSVSVCSANIEQKQPRDFNLVEAQAGAPFRLRSGLPFTILSLNHHSEDNPELKVLIQVEGHPLPMCYYSDGFWNELDHSDFDLVMVD